MSFPNDGEAIPVILVHTERPGIDTWLCSLQANFKLLLSQVFFIPRIFALCRSNHETPCFQ